ncbi:transposable element Tcb1 transposase [Trichonephila clavipes]|nr:transposable element Tcb1 transposase [Trichonephila clavipes]
MITNFFIFELNNHDVQELWFQQDGATCHTARATIDLLKDTFGDRLIPRFGPVNWPPRSCDLTPLDYFLWGYVKSLVYADKPQTLDHLEDNIHRVIADIQPQMLEKVIENSTSRLDYIRASRGNLTPQTVRNYLHNDGFKARTARKELERTECRLEFVRKYVNKPVEFWNNVVFAHESKFNLFGCEGKIIVYRKRNAELEEQNMMSTVKHGGGGFMVWLCRVALGVGNIVVINGIMDHLYYIQILKENLRVSAEKLGIEEY